MVGGVNNPVRVKGWSETVRDQENEATEAKGGMSCREEDTIKCCILHPSSISRNTSTFPILSNLSQHFGLLNGTTD